MVLLGIFVYVPGINTFLSGAPVPIYSWLVVAGVSMIIFAYNEIRKLGIRKYPDNFIVKLFKV